MHGDFSRTTFDQRKHYSGVLAQQGRVDLDADGIEQVAITQHYLRALATDLIGPHGGPGDGFAIDTVSDRFDFAILPGRYYVDGVLCENEGVEATYRSQPDHRIGSGEELQANKSYLIYLDVWERLVTFVEDDSIREIALSGGRSSRSSPSGSPSA